MFGELFARDGFDPCEGDADRLIEQARRLCCVLVHFALLPVNSRFSTTKPEQHSRSFVDSTTPCVLNKSLWKLRRNGRHRQLMWNTLRSIILGFRRQTLPIHEASVADYVQGIREQIQKDPILVNAKSTDGDTPLLLAVVLGHQQAVKVLLESGASVEARNADHDTPLLVATSRGNPEIVQLLLKKGAKPNAMKPDGTTALLLATALGNVAIVEMLLESGAKTNVSLPTEHTPLIIAASKGNLAVAKLLIDHGANMNTKTSQGITALMMAGVGKHHQVVKFLFEKGAAWDQNACLATMATKDRKTNEVFRTYGSELESE
ncbi:MAG: ankyrin repeat domain-containing protein [Opitutaceae bacterium]|jgi:hypothetical protein